MVDERFSRLAGERNDGGGRLGRRLRAITIGAVLGLTAIGGAGTALAVQTDQAGTTTQAPAAGMSVQVAGESGTAQLTVYGIKDTGIPILMDDGTGRLVLVDLKVQNAGDDPFLFNTSRVRMHDDAGQSYGRVRFDNDDDPGLANFRPLRGQEIDDGGQARGWLAFAVDDDSTLRTVSYRDDDGANVGVADLTVASVRLDDDGDWDDDGRADDDGANNVAGTGAGDDDGWGDDDGGAVAGGTYVGDDDGYYGDDDGAYYGGDDDGWDDDGGGYYGGDDDDWGGDDDDGGDD
jgi:hypothetical protein